MAEYIGSRISLISKRDIRYVGTLHEISSENSTVALEQVVSFGTEGRRPDDEVPPSDNVYEYIVFRGSDVKDLRIEEPPKENKPPQPPQVPDDPAILGSARRSTPAANAQATSSQSHAHPQQPQQPPQMQNQQQPPIQNQKQANPSQQMRAPQQMQPPFGNSMPMYPYYYPPPPNSRFGPQGFPPGPNFPGMPYGAPPGWYPPNQGFPSAHHGQFYPPQMQPGPIGPQQRSGPQQMQQPPPSAQVPQTLPTEAQPEKMDKPSQEIPEKPIATVKLPSTTNTPDPLSIVQNGPPPPTESKPDVAAALAPPAPAIGQQVPVAGTKLVPTGPKSSRIIPVVPLRSPAAKVAVPINGTLHSTSGNTIADAPSPVKAAATRTVPVNTMSAEDATEAARRAVAAAMAKTMGQKKTVDGEGTMDNLAKKVSEMRTNDTTRNPRQVNSGGYRGRGDSTVHRGRGGHRGGRSNFEHQTRKIDVPTTDYDFESANAKFNKQDLVKEAIATGSPMVTPDHTSNGNLSGEGSVNGALKESEHSVVVPPTPGYNKSSSFFDNISSEIKDREDRMGGREFRVEEHKKNFETFGQGSVDNGLRGGYRGRGRGRGFGRGRGAFRGARGTFRGGPGAVAAT